MLLLLFEIGTGRYALDANSILEVAPLVQCKKIAATPDYVVGLMNYRGQGIPVLDLNQLFDSVPSADMLSTRIILISYPVKDGVHKPLALIASNVTETADIKLMKPPVTGVFMEKSLYKDGILPETNAMIQWFDIDKMLPAKEIVPLYEEEE